MTLVLRKDLRIPDGVTGGLDTVGIRMPDHPVARELIRLSKCPVAAPSANLSGKPSPTTARHVLRDLYGRIDGVLDGGPTKVGLESTVLDVTSETPVLLRPGGITREEIEAVVGPILVDPNLQQAEGDRGGDSAPRSPGMKYTHYAPKGKVYLVEGEPDRAAAWICRSCVEMQGKGLKTAILCSKETAWHYGEYDNDRGFVEILGSQDDLGSVARHLYGALRRCDQEDIKVIYLEACSAEGLGMAVMNRMYKASGSNLIKV